MALLCLKHIHISMNLQQLFEKIAVHFQEFEIAEFNSSNKYLFCYACNICSKNSNQCVLKTLSLYIKVCQITLTMQ